MAQDLVTGANEETGSVTARMRGSRINRVLVAVEICIVLVVLVLFNVFPEKIGTYSSATQPYVFVPLLTPEWLAYMPWLNTWWVLALTLALVKFVYGRWTQALRWADLGLHLLGICVVGSMVFGWPLSWLDGGWASVSVPLLTSPHQYADPLSMGFEPVFGLILVGLIVGFFTKLAKMGVSLPVLRLR